MLAIPHLYLDLTLAELHRLFGGDHGGRAILMRLEDGDFLLRTAIFFFLSRPNDYFLY
jgi:hypothetical protein